MKTVIDAVNEFKAEFPYIDTGRIIHSSSKNNVTPTFSDYYGTGSQSEPNSNWYSVCTREEFNQCVREMTNYKPITPCGEVPVFTKEMSDKGELPPVGSKFLVGEELCDDSRISDFEGLEVTVIGLAVSDKGHSIITFSNPLVGVGCGVNMPWVKPIEPPKERAVFDLMFHGCQSINEPQSIKLLEAIKAGKIHNVTWGK